MSGLVLDRRWRLVCALLTLLLPLAGIPAVAESASAPSRSAESEPARSVIKIGVIAPLSGVAAETGKDMVDGVQMYLDQIGSKMGGKKVELIVENDEANMAVARAKVAKLAQDDHVDVITGLLLSHITNAVAPLSDKFSVPMICAISAADEPTQRKHPAWFLRTSFSSSQVGHPFGDYAYKKLGYKRIVTLGLDYPYAWEQVGAFQTAFEKAGGQVVQKIWAPLGLSDYSDYLRSIRKDVDAVFMVTTSDGAVKIDQQYAQLGIKHPVIASGSSFDEVVLRHLGAEAVGAISVFNYSAALNTPACQHFVAAYRQKHAGKDPGSYAEGGYTAAMFIAQAVQALHGNVSNKEKFLAVLKKVELSDAPRGPLKLDEYGSAIQNIYVRKVTEENGRLQNTVVDTFPKLSQFWTYKPEEYMRGAAYSRDYPPCTHCKD